MTSWSIYQTKQRYGVLRNDPKLVSSLLQIGANANATDNQNTTALHKAVNRPDKSDDYINSYCRRLLKYGADPTIRPRGLKSKNPFQIATEAGYRKSIDTLKPKYDEFNLRAQRKRDEIEAAGAAGGGGDEDDGRLGFCLVEEPSNCHQNMAAAESLYESADEIGRLMIAIGRMNVDNNSPIFGVEDAPNLSFKESMEEAAVSVLSITPAHSQSFLFNKKMAAYTSTPTDACPSVLSGRSLFGYPGYACGRSSCQGRRTTLDDEEKRN